MAICRLWRNGIRTGLWLRLLQVQVLSIYLIGVWYNGRMTVSKTVDWGSSPCTPAICVRCSSAGRRPAKPLLVGSTPTVCFPVISKSFPTGVVMESLSPRLMVQILPVIADNRSPARCKRSNRMFGGKLIRPISSMDRARAF